MSLKRNIDKMDIFVHDKNGIFLPNFLQLHGSARLELFTHNRNDYNQSSMFIYEIDITRTKWKALDIVYDRCSEGHRIDDTEKCITR